MLILGRQIEAATSIANKDYQTAVGSILSTESRHTAYLRASLGESPFPGPFDTPLTFVGPRGPRILVLTADLVDRLKYTR